LALAPPTEQAGESRPSQSQRDFVQSVKLKNGYCLNLDALKSLAELPILRNHLA
jgi:hypothetical protein